MILLWFLNCLVKPDPQSHLNISALNGRFRALRAVWPDQRHAICQTCGCALSASLGKVLSELVSISEYAGTAFKLPRPFKNVIIHQGNEIWMFELWHDEQITSYYCFCNFGQCWWQLQPLWHAPLPAMKSWARDSKQYVCVWELGACIERKKGIEREREREQKKMERASEQASERVWELECVRVRVHACVRACVRACVCVCVCMSEFHTTMHHLSPILAQARPWAPWQDWLLARGPWTAQHRILVDLQDLTSAKLFEDTSIDWPSS